MVSPLIHASVLTAPLLWSIALKPCLGMRDDKVMRDRVDGTEHQESYTIELLVTRHGLSCANIISDFKPGSMKANWQNLMGNRKVQDPILAEAGVKGSLEMREMSKLVKPDAVLASTLLRAIETAALQYPSNTVHIVPWIRESSSLKKYPGFDEGKDNLPTPFDNQVARLESELKPILNSGEKQTLKDWTNNETRLYNHDWDKFKAFLETEFLRPIIKQLGKPPGSKITLAVVTHSNFMKNVPDIKTPCGKYWSDNGKPYNNQAVNISYVFDKRVVEKRPNAIAARHGVITSTEAGPPVWKLTQNAGRCGQVAPGLKYKTRQLCRRDIGESCENDIAEKKLALPEHLEEIINKKKAEKEGVEKKIEEMVKALGDKFANGYVTSQQEEILSFDKKMKAKNKQSEKEEKMIQDHMKKKEPLKNKIEALDIEIRTLKNLKCFDMGGPAA